MCCCGERRSERPAARPPPWLRCSSATCTQAPCGCCRPSSAAAPGRRPCRDLHLRLLPPAPGGGAAPSRRAVRCELASADPCVWFGSLRSQPRGGRWRMPVVYLSPSLTPRNPTPHAPAVRLYEVGKAAVSGAASGAGARQPPLQVVDILEHSFDVDRSNARGAEQWGVLSLRQAHNVSSFDYGAWA
uniref:Uncharacterized protein n=1 Tax=Emiliania huxleyi TaxID=2903 RepID=A0A7S3T4K5_EMIHU